MNISPCGMPASPQDWACRLLAATRHASGLMKFTLILRERPSALLGMRGWRAEKRKSYGSCLAASRAPSGAPIAAFSGTGPCFRPVRRARCADRSISQLLAGPPIGSRGELRCRPSALLRKARGRRTSSRLTTPHDRAPQWTRCVHHTAGLGGGDKPWPLLEAQIPFGRGVPQASAQRLRPQALLPGRGPGSVP